MLVPRELISGQEIAVREDVRCDLIELDIVLARTEDHVPVSVRGRLDIFHGDTMLGNVRGRAGWGVAGVLAGIRSGEGSRGRIVGIGICAGTVPVPGAVRDIGGFIGKILIGSVGDRVVPRGEISFDGRGTLFPLGGIQADGEEGRFGSGFWGGLDHLAR
jgi:hypothetical protein